MGANDSIDGQKLLGESDGNLSALGVIAPTVTSITPDRGVNTGPLSVTIDGMGFANGATVLLTPANMVPKKAGSIANNQDGAFLESPYGVFVSGNYAYVTDWFSDSLEIVDVSNPANPKHKGSIRNGEGGARLYCAIDVFVSGDYAYVVNFEGDSLEIINVKDPGSPKHAGSIVDGEGGARLKLPVHLFVSGNYAYVAGHGSDALEIVDVSDPAKPVHKGSIANGEGGARLDFPAGVFVSGNYAYVASQFDNALEIVDVSDPAKPVHKGYIINNEGLAALNGAYGVFVSGNYAYVASKFNGALEIVDVSDPANPMHKSCIFNRDGGARLDRPMEVFVSGNYAYVASADSNALEIVDISDPASPRHKGSIELGDAVDVYVSGRYAYVTSTDSNSLEIIDIGTVTGTGVVVANPTRITSCTFDLTGVNPGRYNVVVTNPGGSFGVLTKGFEVKRELSCLWSFNSPVCNGTPVQFNGPSGMDSYKWKFGDGSGSQAEDPVHLYSTHGTYAVSLTATQDGSSKTCEGSVEVTAPDCSWTSSSPVCNGTPVQFSGPAGMDAYQWEFGDGTVSSSEDPSHLYRSPGTYTVNLKAANGGCEKTCTGTVFVNPYPDCSWTSSSPACNGTAVSFDGPSGMDSYSWIFGDGATSTEEDPSHTYSGSGTYTVNLTTTKDGCSKRCEGTVTIKPLPDCTWTSNSPVCDGTAIRFNGPSGMDSYSWNFGDGWTCTTEDPSRTYPGQGRYTVSLTVTKDSCSRKCEGSVEVKAPGCSWTSNSPVCYGTPVQFNGLSGMDAYLWTFGDGTTSRAEDPSHIYRKAGTYTVGLRTYKGVPKICTGKVVVKPLSDCN